MVARLPLTRYSPSMSSPGGCRQDPGQPQPPRWHCHQLWRQQVALVAMTVPARSPNPVVFIENPTGFPIKRGLPQRGERCQSWQHPATLSLCPLGCPRPQAPWRYLSSPRSGCTAGRSGARCRAPAHTARAGSSRRPGLERTRRGEQGGESRGTLSGGCACGGPLPLM